LECFSEAGERVVRFDGVDFGRKGGGGFWAGENGDVEF